MRRSFGNYQDAQQSVHPGPSAGEQQPGQAAPGQKSRTAGHCVCAFLELFLNDGNFPFYELALPSRTPKGHTPWRSHGAGRRPLGRSER
jgi:hypothetical protein